MTTASSRARSPAISCAPSCTLLLDDEFYDEIFMELGIPYEPVRWRIDNPDSIFDKNARIIELIAAYRNRGHLMADIDPLRLDKTRFRSHPDLDVLTHGHLLWRRRQRRHGLGGIYLRWQNRVNRRQSLRTERSARWTRWNLMDFRVEFPPRASAGVAALPLCDHQWRRTPPNIVPDTASVW